MADFGIGEALLASEVAGEAGLATLGPSVLSAEAAFGAPAAMGLLSPAVTGIAGLTGAGLGASGFGGALAGLGETPYLTAYSNAINSGLTIPEASQAAMEAANAANPMAYDPTALQSATQNAANVSGTPYQYTAQGAPGEGSSFNVSVDAAEPEVPTINDDTYIKELNEPTPGSDPFSRTQTVPDTTTQVPQNASVQANQGTGGTWGTPTLPNQSNGIGSLADLAKSAYQGIKGLMPEKTSDKVMLGLGASMAYDKLFNKYGTPAPQKYTGPLSKFNYNPLTYTPAANPTAVYPGRGYADGGGIASLGANPGFPMSQQQNSRYAVASQMPTGAQDVRMANLPPISMAGGGELGGYSDGGRMLKGPGDGMSDSIPASISGKQPARLADGEFVVPADVVSHLGNGSTDAGAKQLYKMMDKVRTARTGTKKQGKQINPKKYVPV